MSVTIGQPAPDFSLFNSDKQRVALSELKGNKVLLLFFPLAFTSTCTKELCGIRDSIGFFNDSNATVLGISVDSLYTLGRFRQEQGLNFQLLSDFNKTTSAAYGSLYENFGYDMKGVSKRSAFVLDREGTVRYAEVLENAGAEPDYGAIRATLASIA